MADLEQNQIQTNFGGAKPSAKIHSHSKTNLLF